MGCLKGSSIKVLCCVCRVLSQGITRFRALSRVMSRTARAMKWIYPGRDATVSLKILDRAPPQ